MRSVVVALALVVATAAVAPAQQFATPESDLTVQSDPRPVEAPPAVGAVELAPVPLTPAAVQAEQTNAALETRTAAQVSAQTVLAVIGAVVVIVALVALFN